MLATTNLISLFGLHRRFRAALARHLALHGIGETDGLVDRLLKR